MTKWHVAWFSRCFPHTPAPVEPGILNYECHCGADDLVSELSCRSVWHAAISTPTTWCRARRSRAQSDCPGTQSEGALITGIALQPDSSELWPVDDGNSLFEKGTVRDLHATLNRQPEELDAEESRLIELLAATSFGVQVVVLRPHDLRHTYAGHLVRAGVPLQLVQKLLGHASIRTTQRYASLADSQRENVRSILG
ncbi:tyrosine-type recombinase/integrase [Nocardia vaccinii]|uniref:tyrosine-type recombinase/integrase n=1 Tax=Nocardia vaccinii TaxID=1822 RepID=UPI001FE1C037|nr:tyrosine-type recombinase/integrase [Nocardia vaccinii]